ncbi:MAG: adenylate/guanylate cyclase domain-containing protein [Gammaproteobacteria bacterium]|nr:adenylate/guanylate cyclase domain-containing protein [Gammaproteobacteria bacterium]
MAARSKLAVILHADVVDSTALVQKDERVAHERIRDVFLRFSETIAAYGGIAHEIRGDALVAEFERASDAVGAALAFQAANAEHNFSLTDAIRPDMRVGIALGEVVVAHGTLTGAGVVLAQRLEQLAESGGVAIQGAVSEAVPARLPFVYESLGERSLKGFDMPIRAYAVALSEGSEMPAPETTRPAVREPATKPFIAVLPFDNLSADPEHGFFADGITEEIITELSRFQSLQVLARTSAFGLKEKAMGVLELHAEFGINYVLEGSVRRAGSRVRITAKLIDARTGSQVWAERYDRDLIDVFDLQDEIARGVVAVVPERLGHAELERAKRQVPGNLSAYDCLLRAKWHHHRRTPQDNAQALEMLERVIELDPQCAAAYGWMGCVLAQSIGLGCADDPAELLARDLDAVRTGLSLDQNDIECNRILCEFGMMNSAWDEAWLYHEKAFALNPNDARIIAQRGELLTRLGRATEGVEALEKAMTLDPFEASARAHLLGRALLAARRYEEAVEAFKRIPELRYDHHADVAACLALMGDDDGAAYHRKAVVALNPDFSISSYMESRTYKKEVDREHHRAGLAKAGLPD